MTGNRKERRADPDRWHRIVAYFDPAKERVVELGENQKGAVCIRGSLDNVIVVQVPDMTPSQQVEILKGVQTVMEGAGIDKPIVLLPDFVKLVKFRTLDVATSKKLDRHAKDKRFSAAVEQAVVKQQTKH